MSAEQLFCLDSAVDGSAQAIETGKVFPSMITTGVLPDVATQFDDFADPNWGLHSATPRAIRQSQGSLDKPELFQIAPKAPGTAPGVGAMTAIRYVQVCSCGKRDIPLTFITALKRLKGRNLSGAIVAPQNSVGALPCNVINVNNMVRLERRISVPVRVASILSMGRDSLVRSSLIDTFAMPSTAARIQHRRSQSFNR